MTKTGVVQPWPSEAMWTVKLTGVYDEGTMVPTHLAMNPWFWRGRRIGLLAARVWYMGR